MKKSTPRQYLIRVGVYCFGLLLLAFGGLLSVRSNLGVSAATSLPYVISLILQAPLGICTTVTYCVFVLLQIIILRKDFQIINLLEIVFSSLFGYFVSFAEFILGNFSPQFYILRLATLGVSIVFVSLGIVIYMSARLVPMPMEGFLDCIARKLGKPFGKVKSVSDCTLVLTSIALGLIFLGRVTGFREGTIITALLTGRMVGIVSKRIAPAANRLCFGTDQQT